MTRNVMKFFWWLRKILYLWVKTKPVPANPRDELEIDPNRPICYVLASQSISDLLVLDQTCSRLGLPRPQHKPTALRHTGAAAYIYMQKIGLVRAIRKGGKQPPSPLSRLVQQAEADPSMDIQLVPVSVFWGRNPGKEERKIYKLLFFDDERAGILQKFFIVLAQGRNNFIQYGRPISLRQTVDEGLGLEQTARKLRRVLRVHFVRNRTATLGPSIPSRNHVAASLVATRAVRQAIVAESEKKKISVLRAENRARRYILEIAAEIKYPVVLLADKFLAWLWNKIFDGVDIQHGERTRNIAQGQEIVYLPSHRSHMDYLLLCYCLYHIGLVPPHVAAGVNLNFWPIGLVLRRAGAFYIRRSFGGNRLYAAVFNEYVHYLLTGGYSVKFYPEGGRSRTGRLLQPKTGMLAMVVHSYLRDSRRPITMVPIFIGYDKVMEVRTYLKELHGSKKRRESIGQLLQARKIFKSDFGQAYIGFGEPLSLEEFLDRRKPGWRDELPEDGSKPSWMGPIVHDLALEVLERVNSAAIVSPVALFSLVILSSPQRAMTEDDLTYLMDKFLEALRDSPFSRDVKIPEISGKEMLAKAEKLCRCQRFKHSSGDVIHLDEVEATILSYYKNTIAHLIALPSLVASYFQHNDAVNEQDIVDGGRMLFPFLKHEYFLHFSAESCEAAVRNIISALEKMGLVHRNGSTLSRPDIRSREFLALKTLGRSLGQTLDRYAISASILANYQNGEAFKRAEFEEQCQLMGQRLALLSGVSDPEFLDRGVFRHYVELLKRLGYIEDGDDGMMVIKKSVAEISDKTIALLSADMRTSIQRSAGAIEA